MSRQFAPVLPEARARTQARQAFGGSRGGAVRNAAPVRGRSRAGAGGTGGAAGAMYPSQTRNVAAGSEVTLTLGAVPLEQSLLITVAGVLLAPSAYSVAGAVVTLGSALSASDVLVDQYWTPQQNPPASVLS